MNAIEFGFGFFVVFEFEFGDQLLSVVLILVLIYLIRKKLCGFHYFFKIL